MMVELPPQVRAALLTWGYESPDEDILCERFVAEWGSWEETALLHALAATDDLPDHAVRSTHAFQRDDLEVEFAHFISIYSLGWLGTSTARDALAARLGTRSTESRWACAIALGITQDPRSISPLERMLTERYPVRPGYVALQAPRSLWAAEIAITASKLAIKSGDGPQEPTRRDYYDDRSGDRSLAVELLAEGNRIESIPALRNALCAALAAESYEYQPGLFAFHLHWTGFFEPEIVYGLGQLGAAGALTGVEGIEGSIPRTANNMDTGTQGRLAMWRVHLVLGYLQAHTRLTSDDSSLRPRSLWEHSPNLRVDTARQLERLYGLSVAECERDLEAYDHDLISAQVWQYHLNAKWRHDLTAQLARTE